MLLWNRLKAVCLLETSQNFLILNIIHFLLNAFLKPLQSHPLYSSCKNNSYEESYGRWSLSAAHKLS